MFERPRFFWVLTVAFILSLTACGGAPSNNSSNSNPPVTLSPTIAPLPTVPLQPTSALQPTIALQATVTAQPTTASPTFAASTVAPTANSNSGTVAGKILFQDDFSNPASGWIVTKTDYGEFSYDNGTFLYAINKPNYVTHALLPNQTFDNVSLEADMTLDQGGKNAALGLICRAAANSTQLKKGYKFLVVPGAGYGILEQTGVNASDFKLLVEKEQADAVPTSGTIHLRADCAGDHLALYENGNQLVETTNSDLTSGQVGFAVSSPQNQGVTVRFDNLIVRAATP